MMITMAKTATGYVMADLILRLSSTCFSMVEASESSTRSSTPPVSPALTMAT